MASARVIIQEDQRLGQSPEKEAVRRDLKRFDKALSAIQARWPILGTLAYLDISVYDADLYSGPLCSLSGKGDQGSFVQVRTVIPRHHSPR